MYWQFLQLRGCVDPDRNPFSNLLINQKNNSKKNNSRQEFSVKEINQLTKEIKNKVTLSCITYFKLLYTQEQELKRFVKIKKSDIGKGFIKITDSKTKDSQTT